MYLLPVCWEFDQKPTLIDAARRDGSTHVRVLKIDHDIFHLSKKTDVSLLFTPPEIETRGPIEECCPHEKSPTPLSRASFLPFC